MMFHNIYEFYEQVFICIIITFILLYMSLQPPIQVFGLEGRYATALFSAASKQKALDAVEKDLVTFQV